MTAHPAVSVGTAITSPELSPWRDYTPFRGPRPRSRPSPLNMPKRKPGTLEVPVVFALDVDFALELRAAAAAHGCSPAQLEYLDAKIARVTAS